MCKSEGGYYQEDKSRQSDNHLNISMDGEKGSIFRQLVCNDHQGDQGGGGEPVRDHSTNSSVSVKQSREEKIKSERNYRWGRWLDN